MARSRLDPTLMRKLAVKLGKPSTVPINKLVYQYARRRGISSEAALVLVARQHGLGTAKYQRGLDPASQAELRGTAPPPIMPLPKPRGPSGRKGVKIRAEGPINILKPTIRSLLQDEELYERSGDLLAAHKHFDRPINQATLVLEERIRQKSKPPTRLVGENLVNYAFNEDRAKTVLQVASAESDDQRGFTQILRGIVPAFRNKTHHHITSTFSREDAMRVCAFVDVLLRVVDGCTKLR